MYDVSDKKNAIKALQTCLLELSHVIPELPSHAVTGVFSETTRDDLMIFQNHAGLPCTGIADAPTWAAIKREYDEAKANRECEKGLPFPVTLPLSLGSRGTSVTLVQAVIGELCEVYGSIPAPGVTGRYGSPTAYAVGMLQRRYELPETGTLDAPTWRKTLADYTARTRLSEGQDG
ncbi:MAG: peptidoglycan-binding protein [Clostridia bacterium]|nr:peptidoglycan-binding protein [Clostridia bacterium]